ncbi:phosphoserine phosphatase SerB [Lentisphaera profundi]|uniref:Phosphoserine phosphatase n=1 Tax=Lentisphaera profundi TaxID=1658616 RepID=A0ABY7VSS8_9BACT|nr:phosphoserine phosphatase SerB [Lentisphaera profundi]WDE97097.1 phosphoserine phosphatase SerB [Lentisphaera profundi]
MKYDFFLITPFNDSASSKSAVEYFFQSREMDFTLAEEKNNDIYNCFIYHLELEDEKIKILQEQLLTKLQENSKSDGVILPRDYFKNQSGFIAFDMDSTLIECECIDELAVKAGVGDEVKKVTAAAMRGELDFSESFVKRLSLLDGLKLSALDELKDELPLMAGMESLVTKLVASPWKTAVFSGGFTYFADSLQERFGFDYVRANVLECGPEALTGKHIGGIVDSQVKKESLLELAAKENIDPAFTVAVGDGANDLPMIHTSGQGFAFHAKPIVCAEAPNAVKNCDLSALEFILNL